MFGLQPPRHISALPWSCENALAEALTRRDFGEVAAMVILPSLGFFLPEVLLMPDAGPSRALLQQAQKSICDGYALIAAMSGWMPMMFMTRVRL
jgi:hypothetical protein